MPARKLLSIVVAAVLGLGVLAAGGVTLTSAPGHSTPRECCVAENGSCTCCDAHRALLSTLSVCSCDDDATTTSLLQPGLAETLDSVTLVYPAIAAVRGTEIRPSRGYEQPFEKPPPV